MLDLSLILICFESPLFVSVFPLLDANPFIPRLCTDWSRLGRLCGLAEQPNSSALRADGIARFSPKVHVAWDI